MKNRILLIIFILLFSSVAFSGCLNTNASVDKTLVIQAIGVDYDFKKNEYIVSMQCYDLAKSGSKGEADTGKITKVFVSKGKSIKQAMDKTTQITGETPLDSQNRIIIFGEEVLKEGIESTIDLFIRDYRIRSNLPVAVAKGVKAEDIVKANEGNAAIPAQIIQLVMESGHLNSYCTEITVVDVVKLENEKTSSIIMPTLTIKKEKKNQYAKLDGLAIFKNNKLYDYLSPAETRAFKFVIDDIRAGTFVIENTPMGRVTFSIVDSKTKTKTVITDNGKLEYDIKIKCSVDVTEAEKDSDDKISNREAEVIQDICNKKIKGDVENVLKKCLVEDKCDPFRFGQRLWQKSPENYRKLSKDWANVLPDIKTNITVDTTIRRTGKFPM
ncbi:MAG: Ger(x)C family spore germination protein [Oscillospiraceae bacterium]